MSTAATALSRFLTFDRTAWAHLRDSTPLTGSLYWRLRARGFHLVPGVVRFYDTRSLGQLIEDGGLTIVETIDERRGVSMMARA